MTSKIRLSKSALQPIRAGNVRSVKVSASAGGKTVLKNLRVQRE